MESNKEEVLTEESLRPGDLLFTMSGDEAGHASIYAPKASSKLTTVHADNDGDYKQLKKTSLPPGDYIVFRCKDSKLADLAALIADNWASYNTPYDEQRLQIGTKVYSLRTNAVDPTERQAVAVTACRKDFEDTGKYRLVKYAARRGASITLPEGHGRGRGVWCAMFTLMCYQTAAVAKAALVKPVVGDGEHRWVSDKYNDPKQTKSYFSSNAPAKSHLFQFTTQKPQKEAAKNYTKYVEKIHGLKEYSGYDHKDFHKLTVNKHAMHSPSLIAWDFAKYGDIKAFDFEPILSSGLMLEQKTTDPEILMHSLDQDKKLWKKEGTLKVAITPTLNQDNDYQEEFNKFIIQSKVNANEMKNYLEGKIEKSPTFDLAIEGENQILSSPGRL
jgi:hypothetical protein